MNPTEHHELSLGVLALAYHEVESRTLKIAIEQAIESAAELGFPVSVEKLKGGEPIGIVEQDAASKIFKRIHAEAINKLQ